MNKQLLVLTTCMFVLAMLGHFVGDYLFQNEWMAQNKAKRNVHGWLACMTHVNLYTFAVMFFLFLVNHDVCEHWKLLLIIWVPHYFIDHYSAASYILLWKNGYKPFDVVKDGNGIGRTNDNHDVVLTNPGVHALWKTSFGAPVYIMNDNVLHFVCLYFTCMALAAGVI